MSEAKLSLSYREKRDFFEKEASKVRYLEIKEFYFPKRYKKRHYKAKTR